MPKKAITIVKSSQANESTILASLYNNLAFIYRKQNKYSESEKLYIKSIQLGEKLIGKNNIDMAYRYYGFGLLRERQNRNVEALKLLTKGADIFKNKGLINHPMYVKLKKDIVRLSKK